MIIRIDLRKWAGRLMAVALWVLLALIGTRVIGDGAFSDFFIGFVDTAFVMTVHKPWSRNG